MFFIPGFLISILTFPGVIVHEIAHQLFCRWARVAVLDVCYFRFGNPAGFVVHEPPRHAWQSLLIGIGPFFVNTLIGMIIGIPIAVPLRFGNITGLNFFLVWLAVSIAMHAFPSTGDAASIWKALNNKTVPILVRLIGFPIVALIFLGAIGSFFWLDALYGIAVVAFLPYLLIKAIAGGG